MKSELIIVAMQKVVTYPYLGLYDDSSFVVLFSGPGTGMVVFVDASPEKWPVASPYDLGHFYINWLEERFTRIPSCDSVRLHNSAGALAAAVSQPQPEGEK